MNLDLPSMVGYRFNQRMLNAPQVSPPQFLQVKPACNRSQDLSLRNTLSSMCIDLHVHLSKCVNGGVFARSFPYVQFC
jgi:hypothetical protein